MGRSISFHWFFIILTMVFNIFHCFFHYMVQPKIIMPLWWKDMGFKKRTAYRLRNLGGILTLFSPESPLKNPGRHSVIFHYFQDVVHYFSVIFHYFQGVFHYFSLVFQCRYMCFIIFQCFFQCFRDVHYFSLSFG